jgi:phospholipase/carboxylesterase
MQNPSEPPVTLEPNTRHRASVIWLHGLGADGHDFVPVLKQLGLQDTLGIRFILPHAPFRPITINGGYVMRGWYDILSRDLSEGIDLKGIGESRATLEQLVHAEIDAGIARDKIVVGGFSQGSVVSLDWVTKTETPVAGCIALSGYLPETPAPYAPTGRTPIFLGHGLEDDIVRVGLGHLARDQLVNAGFTVDWNAYPIPHSVNFEEIEDIRNWLSLRLKA